MKTSTRRPPNWTAQHPSARHSSNLKTPYLINEQFTKGIIIIYSGRASGFAITNLPALPLRFALFLPTEPTVSFSLPILPPPPSGSGHVRSCIYQQTICEDSGPGKTSEESLRILPFSFPSSVSANVLFPLGWQLCVTWIHTPVTKGSQTIDRPPELVCSALASIPFRFRLLDVTLSLCVV